MKAVASIIGGAVLAAVTFPAFAAEPAYLDDRSTAAALIRSFYNAVNRHEYARAYTYFGPNGGPKPYEIFAQGYADTQFVTVATGTAPGGSAGSVSFAALFRLHPVTRTGTRTVTAVRRMAFDCNEHLTVVRSVG